MPKTKVANLSEPVVLTFQHQPQPVSVSKPTKEMTVPLWPGFPSPPLSSESLDFNKMTEWPRAPTASRVQMGWWPDTDFLGLAHDGVACNGIHSAFLSLQKNVTLQCVFWVEDPACECGGVPALGRHLEEKGILEGGRHGVNQGGLPGESQALERE